MSLVWAPDQIEKRRLLFQPCRSREELRSWVYFYLGLDLPGVIVDQRSTNPSTTNPLDMLCKLYFRFMSPKGGEADPAEMMFYAAREAGKTLVVAIMEVLAMLHVGTDVVHLAALVEQAHDAQKYVKGFLEKPDLQGLVVGDAKERTTVVYYRSTTDGITLFSKEWKALSLDEKAKYVPCIRTADIIAATVRATNGKHVGMVVLDELDIIQDPRIIGEARNIPSPIRHEDGSFTDPLTVYISTRKTAFGPVQKAIDEAPQTGLVVEHFNILDVTERCPTSRHLPDMPMLTVYRSDETLRAVDEGTYEAFDPKTKGRYVRDQAYTGCMTQCKIFASCKGQLATMPEVGLDSYLVKPLSHVVKKLTGQAIDYVRSQLLCYKPSSTGLIYGHLFTAEHFLTPAQVYFKVAGKVPPEGDRMTKVQLIDYFRTLDVDFGAGSDYGTAHDFSFILGVKFGIWGFVLRALVAPDLDIDQKIDYSEPLRYTNPRVWGDTSSPDTISYFKKKGWRMQDWTKGKGTLAEGIDIVKYKLRPPGDAATELYFVLDESDDEMVRFVQQIKEHAWKLDARGAPTNIPSEIYKDAADGLRYWIMNEFPITQRGFRMASLSGDRPATTVVPAATPSEGGISKEMTQIVRDLLGGPSIKGRPGQTPGKKGRLRFLS